MADLKKRLMEKVDRARASGRVVTIDLPATRDEINDLELRCGTLAPELRDLVEYAAGFTVDTIDVDFLGQQPFEFDAMFTCGIPIATDGGGNFWVVDVRLGGEWGVVFFVAHDPPVAVVQARDVASFIDQVFGARDATAMKGDAVSFIWQRNPYVISRAQALASPNPTVKVFAEQVDENFAVADLRDGEPGKGFVWGSAGPNTAVRRAGDELLFAIEQKKRGLFARLLSR